MSDDADCAPDHCGFRGQCRRGPLAVQCCQTVHCSKVRRFGDIIQSHARRGTAGANLHGPPPREATIIRTDRERQAEEELTGEEAVGGSVATPDQDNVDALGDALGVPRAPDEELRTSDEILEGRDRHRGEAEDTPAE